ncbi:unnamed protein product [Protopolystoma xenopodis]|uniref:Uncharacterized protein n=1 Tax=Protopolystoma xenopodis TaxID=117903 RepID=A0A3S5FFP6_9PLAT|nr:unnamed protein product [Protopolystoma xenopodis]
MVTDCVIQTDSNRQQICWCESAGLSAYGRANVGLPKRAVLTKTLQPWQTLSSIHSSSYICPRFIRSASIVSKRQINKTLSYSLARLPAGSLSHSPPEKAIFTFAQIRDTLARILTKRSSLLQARPTNIKEGYMGQDRLAVGMGQCRRVPELRLLSEPTGQDDHGETIDGREAEAKPI